MGAHEKKGGEETFGERDGREMKHFSSAEEPSSSSSHFAHRHGRTRIRKPSKLWYMVYYITPQFVEEFFNKS